MYITYLILMYILYMCNICFINSIMNLNNNSIENIILMLPIVKEKSDIEVILLSSSNDDNNNNNTRKKVNTLNYLIKDDIIWYF